MNTFTRNITAAGLAIFTLTLCFTSNVHAHTCDEDPEPLLDFHAVVYPSLNPQEAEFFLQYGEIELHEETPKHPKAKNMNKLMWDPCLESSSTGDRPTEEITLGYTEVEWTY